MKSNESQFIIYGLTDPDTNEVRYVGKSASGLDRPREHKKPCNLETETHKNHWIKSLMNQGKTYGIKVIEEVTNPDLLSDREIYWIATYKQSGVKLTNGTDGGEGALGREVKEETKKIMSEKRKEFHKQNPDVAKKVAEKQRKPHKFIDGIEMKSCNDCEQYKPLTDYSTHKNGWDGYHTVCKPCAKIRTAEYRKKNPPKKLSPEDWKKSYENRSYKMGESIKKRFAEDPSYKEKLSKSRSKAIIRINPLTGEEKEYNSGLAAKADGFDNTYVSQSCKYGGQYKGFYWKFKQ